MAQYTYRCASLDCANEFDVIIHPDHRNDWQRCSKCGSDSYRLKINTGTTFDIRGDGVYHQGMPKKS